jgi:tetratricopeptide (TPR) repeat protein
MSYGIDDVVAALTRAAALRLEGDAGAALAAIDTLLDHLPHFAPALLERATLLGALARYEEALIDCARYLSHAPDNVSALQLREALLAGAVADCAAKLPLAADAAQVAELLYRRANAWLQYGDHHRAECEYASLLAQLAAAGAPPHLGALGNRGYALLALQRTAEALVPYTQLAALAPDDALAHYNRANVLKDLGRLIEAEDGYRRALALKNDFAEAALELAHCLLSAGDFTAGWRLYGRRWQTAQLRPHALRVAAPLWLGETPLENKTILLWAEQGLGDTIQFARFVPMVADLAGQVVVRAPASLVSLLQSLDDRVAVIPDGAPLPACDLHCPLLSLPLALGVDQPPSMPGARRFNVDAAARERWQGWLTEAGGPGPRRPRIGLAWAGRQTGYVNRSRDVPLAALWPLAAIDAAFISLQREVPASDAAALAQWPALIQAGALPADFMDLAALIDTLDIVVCVDSVIAHLAGSLGKPVMLLLRRSGEWRWNCPGADGQDTPWYPSLRILRQDVQGDWTPVLARLRGELLAASIQ